jgi:hypothetical protein
MYQGNMKYPSLIFGQPNGVHNWFPFFSGSHSVPHTEVFLVSSLGPY